jgi:hypothetical protein
MIRQPFVLLDWISEIQKTRTLSLFLQVVCEWEWRKIRDEGEECQKKNLWKVLLKKNNNNLMIMTYDTKEKKEK